MSPPAESIASWKSIISVPISLIHAMKIFAHLFCDLYNCGVDPLADFLDDLDDNVCGNPVPVGRLEKPRHGEGSRWFGSRVCSISTSVIASCRKSAIR